MHRERCVDPDRPLVDEATAGSREAFDELVRRHQSRIYALAQVLTDGDLEAQDLVQETFVRAFRSVTRFRGDSAFGTWLHRIALNVIKTHVARRGRRTPTVSLAVEADRRQSGMEQLASDDDLEVSVASRQLIDRALASLPEELKVVITLRDVQGLEYREIAAVTGLPLGTVESRLFRARQRLRPLLEPLLKGEG